jgi:hypothetical protein
MPGRIEWDADLMRELRTTVDDGEAEIEAEVDVDWGD